MGSTNPLSKQTLWQEGPFQFINPDDFATLGIDPSSVPLGTFASFKHPSQLRSRFGGNAYGFGLFEDYDRLKPKEIEQLHRISLESPDDIRAHYKELNEIYRKMGLLIRFSRLGKRYYLIPVHLMSNSLIHIMAKVDEISKIVGFHKKKYFKEYHRIGVLCRPDDLILHELTFRLKEHLFLVLDSPDKFLNVKQKFDLVILTSDLYEIVLMEKFSPLAREAFSKRRLDQYCIYLLWKLRNLLKAEGEIFILADHFTAKTHQSIEMTFKTEQEEKHFLLFSHLFDTKKRYKVKDHMVRVNIFDLQKYLSAFYVEQEGINLLLGGRTLEEISLEEINDLPYINTKFEDWPFFIDQEKAWPRLLSPFFDKIFLKPVVPDPVKKEWKKRFLCKDYSPKYMIIYLGQKKPVKTTVADVKKDVAASNLGGCPIELVADYRNSFEYLIRTLRVVVGRLKRGSYQILPQVFIDRLKLPLESKSRRFSALNDVIKLTTKMNRLERIRGYLNPDRIEGSKTKLFENLEALPFFGFTHNELKEIILIALGHTALGRIISGKVTEKALKPVSDLARTYDPRQALNLLRYCRLMTLAETEASRDADLTYKQLQQLFELYESAVRVVVNQELDWEQLLDEKIAAMGGIHNKIVQKILMMMNYFEFLDNWPELRQKGPMEKESLADYDEQRLVRIENVIKLVNKIEQFEEMYLKFDPLQLPVFYRKFLELEFYGTLHLFERMDSENVFVLLWIAVNVARGEIINFNPVLADVETLEIEDRVKKVEQEASSVNIEHLDLTLLKQFSDQLNQEKTSFIMGTGFQLKVQPRTQALEIAYTDVSKDIERLAVMSHKIEGQRISEIPVPSLKTLEMLFSNLEAFFQSHLRLVTDADNDLRIPAKQKKWFQEIDKLRASLRTNFLGVMFRPECLYTDIDLLFNNAPSLLNFLLPEFMALQDLDISGHIYLTSPVTDYIITATRKFQALITHDKQSFHDTDFLHRLAQKEFGPMAAGIVGVSESQLENLWKIIEGFKTNPDLFDALAKSLIFQDLGRLPDLRKKYREEINPADLAGTGALFVEKAKIAERYRLTEQGKSYLVFLIGNHGLLHHTVRGEISFAALKSITDAQDKELFDAFLVSSFIMLSAIREDLILEDLAARLFQIRAMCHKIIDGKTTLEEELSKVFEERGSLFCILERYQAEGLPEGTSLTDCLESGEWTHMDRARIFRAGRMIFATERLLRLSGIRHVEFQDLVNLMLKVPLTYIHKKRRFHNVGYATFEKEVYEAFRVYRTLQTLAEPIRHFILDQLIGDKVRIFGYEKVSGFLSYENQIRLLLVGLLGIKKIRSDDDPISLSFLGMSQEIEKRYEAVNDCLNNLVIQKLWEEGYQLTHLFNAKTGILLRKERFPNLLSVEFHDRISISRKISYLSSINDLEQLKNYFHYSLRSLRKYPFSTDDYELRLEEAFEKRMVEITDMILNRAERQMGLVKDFEDLHNLVNDLLDRSWDIGFSREQKHRLNDLYEMRKDALKREKLTEIEGFLQGIHDKQELKDYWRSIKWYLQKNRRFFGKEFEYFIAEKFDAVSASITAG
ncbi:MAG: hypothetical protein JRL30_01490 [Deltaproteobacteria bacterium]|nr:hypothetical protein [Deltaproteobacteria bacterium]